MFLHHNNSFKSIFAKRNMTMRSSAAKGILKYIAGESANSLLVFRRSNQPLLKDFYDSGHISKVDLYKALEQAVFNETVDAVKRLRSGAERYLDHTTVHPEHIAYTIVHGDLKRWQLRELNKYLDHSEDLAEFCRSHPSEKVVSNLLDKLLEPPKEFHLSASSDKDWDPHPVCLDCD